MALSKPKLTVYVEGEEHKLDVIPKESCKVVVLKKEKIYREINFQAFATLLDQVGKFVRIAYYGAVAAGHTFTEIQIDIQRLQIDITHLCNKASLTLSEFINVSETILSALNNTYRYLIQHTEKIGLTVLGNASKLAGKMAAAALELHGEFEAEREKVVRSIEKFQRKKGDTAMEIAQKKKDREQLLRDIDQQWKLIRDLWQLECEAEAKRCEIDQSQDEDLQSISPAHQVNTMIRAFTSMDIQTVCHPAEGENQEMQWKEKKIKAFGKEKEICDIQYDALAKMKDMTTEIMGCISDQKMPEITVIALHRSIGTLKDMAGSMMQAANFWKQMEEHWNSLANDDSVKTQIETALTEYDEDMRMRIWTSNPFKEQGILLYAEWVAFKGICTEYMEQVKVTQNDLYEYLKENPTESESRQNIKSIVEEFITTLTKKQEAITNKKRKAQEEIDALIAKNLKELTRQ